MLGKRPRERVLVKDVGVNTLRERGDLEERENAVLRSVAVFLASTFAFEEEGEELDLANIPLRVPGATPVGHARFGVMDHSGSSRVVAGGEDGSARGAEAVQEQQTEVLEGVQEQDTAAALGADGVGADVVGVGADALADGSENQDVGPKVKNFVGDVGTVAIAEQVDHAGMRARAGEEPRADDDGTVASSTRIKEEPTTQNEGPPARQHVEEGCLSLQEDHEDEKRDVDGLSTKPPQSGQTKSEAEAENKPATATLAQKAVAGRSAASLWAKARSAVEDGKLPEARLLDLKEQFSAVAARDNAGWVTAIANRCRRRNSGDIEEALQDYVGLRFSCWTRAGVPRSPTTYVHNVNIACAVRDAIIHT